MQGFGDKNGSARQTAPAAQIEGKTDVDISCQDSYMLASAEEK